MAVSGPLLETTNRVSLEDAIVGKGWGDPNIGQLCKLSINVLTKTQQFDRFLNRFGRNRDEPNRRDPENQKSSASACHIGCRYQILWLCGASRDDNRSALWLTETCILWRLSPGASKLSLRVYSPSSPSTRNP